MNNIISVSNFDECCNSWNAGSNTLKNGTNTLECLDVLRNGTTTKYKVKVNGAEYIGTSHQCFRKAFGFSKTIRQAVSGTAVTIEKTITPRRYKVKKTLCAENVTVQAKREVRAFLHTCTENGVILHPDQVNKLMKNKLYKLKLSYLKERNEVLRNERVKQGILSKIDTLNAEIKYQTDMREMSINNDDWPAVKVFQAEIKKLNERVTELEKMLN